MDRSFVSVQGNFVLALVLRVCLCRVFCFLFLLLSRGWPAKEGTVSSTGSQVGGIVQNRVGKVLCAVEVFDFAASKEVSR